MKMEENSQLLDIIVQKMKHSHTLSEIKKSLQLEVSKPKVYSGDLKKHMKKFIKESGSSVEVENFIFQILTNRLISLNIRNESAVESLDYIKKAQRSWEKCLIKSINSMCTELVLPLSRRRPEKEQMELREKFESMTLGAEYNDNAYTKLRPVYSSTDFFEVLVGIKNGNTKSSTTKGGDEKSFSLLKACLYSPNFDTIKNKFPHLTGAHHQFGIHDLFESSFVTEWTKLGHKIISKKHMGAARQFLKQGCPPGIRKCIWIALFGISVNDMDVLYQEQLKNYVFEFDMLIDYLIMKDVRLTATNDDAFFVFEDTLYQLLLVFSRDTCVLQHFDYSSTLPPKSYVHGKLGVPECCVTYPPNGVFPFHGFSMLAAPLCYIFENPVELYYVFRYLYMRYFFYLHTISSHSDGILSICTLFENLLQSQEPELSKHLKEMGAQPLRIVFNWFIFAYSGYLATEETLQLWDRIFGYDSLLILAVLAVAILSYRRDNLLSSSSPSAAEAVLADISTIKVIPVLVHFLSGRLF